VFEKNLSTNLDLQIEGLYFYINENRVFYALEEKREAKVDQITWRYHGGRSFKEESVLKILYAI